MLDPMHERFSPPPELDPETIVVSDPVVACDGGGGPMGHPLIYMPITERDVEICCPYCSRRYRLAAGIAPAAGH